MRKINWKFDISRTCVCATVGCIVMSCYRHSSKRKNAKFVWIADVFIKANRMDSIVWGPNRKSIDEAKRDAIRIAREILFDYQSCMDAELKNWD